MDKVIDTWDRLVEADKYFSSEKYKPTVDLAKKLFETGELDLCVKELEKLPTRSDLLKELIEKLRGKSVYKTLTKIQEEKIDNDLTTLKGLFSLGTHIVIECEHGNKAYGMLIPGILEKISEIAYNIL